MGQSQRIAPVSPAQMLYRLEYKQQVYRMEKYLSLFLNQSFWC